MAGALRGGGPIAVGIAWFTNQDDYYAFRAVMEDLEGLPVAYDGWQDEAHRALAALTGAGVCPLKVYVDVTGFTAWCAERARPPTSKTLRVYVAEIARASMRNALEIPPDA